MTFGGYLKIFRRRWLVILLSTFVAALVMWMVTPAQVSTEERPVSYTATATLLVAAYPRPTPTDGSTLAPDPTPMMSLDRIALYMTTGTVPKRAAKALGFTEDPALLATQVTVTTDQAAQAITIASTMADGKKAAATANTFANESIRFFEKDKTVKGEIVLTMLQRATPLPNWPSGGFVIPADRPSRTGIAAGLGLLLGLALALILEQIFARLRSRDEVGKAFKFPVLAEVPRLSKSSRGQIMVMHEPLSPFADAYRGVRAALLHAPVGRGVDATAGVRPSEALNLPSGRAAEGPARVILVTSSHAGEGKTTSIANLAASFAETGLRVLVLDADLRSPDAHLLLDVPEGAGISDYLSNPATTSLDRLARPSTVPGVRMVTAGTSLERPETMSSRLGMVIAEARELADIVLVDTAPVLEASDTFDLLPLVDSVVLVVRSGRLTEVDAGRTAELLRRFQVTVAGVILVAVTKTSGGRYGYGYGYGAGKPSKGTRAQGAPGRPGKAAYRPETLSEATAVSPAVADGDWPRPVGVLDGARDD